MLYKGIVMQIDELTKFTLLFDCYGKLLSEKQYEVMDKFLNLDIGESEMAELENGSRQAIHDAIKKAKKQLLEFEEKCGFVKFKNDLANELTSIENNIKDCSAKNKIKEIITKL